MSEAANANPRDRIKLAAIPVLALVLLWVVTGGSEDEAPPPVALTQPAGTRPGDKPGQPARPARRPAAARPAPAPAFSLAEILAHDPFAVPKALAPPPPIPDEQDTQPVSIEAPLIDHESQARARREMLAQKRVSIIHHGPSGATAVIDSRAYREGDELADGVRIVKIRPDGVIVEVQEVY